MAENPYDFIMQDRPKGKSKLIPTGTSTSSRLLVAVAGFFILVIVAVVLFVVLSGGKGAGADKLAAAAEQQAEIIRVAKIGVEKAQNRDATDLAITTQLSMQSDQLSLLAILKKAGKKLSTKNLDTVTNAQDDTILNTAEQANQFDTAMTTLIKQLLTKYQQDLNEAYNVAGSSTKFAIGDLYNHASLIIKQPAK